MREDSCSGVGAVREMELGFSIPEGGAGSLWRNSSSMLLCSLLFRPYEKAEKQSTIKMCPKPYRAWRAGAWVELLGIQLLISAWS